MSAVRSRVLLGVGAWVLGATSATAGSLYAVNLLGNSLLSAPSRQMSVEMVKADLAQENAQRTKPLPVHRSRQSSRTARTHEQSGPRTSPSHSATPGPVSSSAGVFLNSPDGGAEAACQSGGAYLLYWTPEPGFEADQVKRGPAAVASLEFLGASSGILMQVSCSAGVPVKRLTNVGGWQDE